MKTVLTMVLLTVMSCGMLSAQDSKSVPQGRNFNTEEIMQKRIERMQKALLLDEKDAEKFAPLYKEYLKELRATFEACPVKDRKNLTDEQKEQLKQFRQDCKKKMEATQKTYYPKFKEFLNDAQLEKLFNNEGRTYSGKRDFNYRRGDRKRDHSECCNGPRHHRHC